MLQAQVGFSLAPKRKKKLRPQTAALSRTKPQSKPEHGFAAALGRRRASLVAYRPSLKSEGEFDPIIKAPDPKQGRRLLASSRLKPQLGTFSRTLQQHRRTRTLKTANAIDLKHSAPFSKTRVERIFNKILDKQTTEVDSKLLMRALKDSGLSTPHAKEYTAAYFAQADLNGDKVITSSEFLKDAIRTKLWYCVQDILAGRIKLKHLDEDQDGQLDRFEVTRFLVSVFGRELGKQEAKAVFEALDVTETGRVSFRELNAWAYATQPMIQVSEVVSHALENAKPRLKRYPRYEIPVECLALLPPEHAMAITAAKEDLQATLTRGGGSMFRRDHSSELELLTPETREMLTMAMMWHVQYILIDLIDDYECKPSTLFRYLDRRQIQAISEHDFVQGLLTLVKTGMVSGLLRTNGGEELDKLLLRLDDNERDTLFQELLQGCFPIFSLHKTSITQVRFLEMIGDTHAQMKLTRQAWRKAHPIIGTHKEIAHLYPLLCLDNNGSKTQLKKLYANVKRHASYLEASDLKAYYDPILKKEARKCLEDNRPMAEWAKQSGPFPEFGLRRSDAYAIVQFCDYTRSSRGKLPEYKWLDRLHSLDVIYNMQRASIYNRKEMTRESAHHALFENMKQQQQTAAGRNTTQEPDKKQPTSSRGKKGKTSSLPRKPSKRRPKSAYKRGGNSFQNEQEPVQIHARLRAVAYSEEWRQQVKRNRLLTQQRLAAEPEFDNSAFV